MAAAKRSSAAAARQSFAAAASAVLLLAMALAAGGRARAEAPAGAAPAAPPPAALKFTPDVVAPAKPSVDIEADPQTRLLLAPVTIGGVTGRFVLGTGSPHTVVVPEFAAKAGLDKNVVMVGVRGGAEGEQAKLSRVACLAVGATEFKDFDVRILALDQLTSMMERPPDGLLGADVLLALPITLDYVGRRLTFALPKDLTGRKEAPAEIFAFHLKMPGTLDGQQRQFIVDTGNNLSFITKDSWTGKTEQIQGLNFAVVQEVTLGQLAATDLRFALGNMDVIGLDFLAKYVVAIDAPGKKMYFKGGPAPATAQATDPKTPAPEPLKPLSPALEKQASGLRSRLLVLQEEELKIVGGIMESQQKMLDALGMTADEAAESLAKGRTGNTKLLRDYKAILTGLIQKLQAVDAKFATSLSKIQTMAADRKTPELKAHMTPLENQVFERRRSIHEKIAELNEKAGDYPSAIAIYRAEADALTGRKRLQEARAVKEKMADAHDKAGDPRSAVSILRAIYDSIPEKDRRGEINLMVNLANMYQKSGNDRQALALFEEVKKLLAPGQKVGNLDEVIATLKAKVGNP